MKTKTKKRGLIHLSLLFILTFSAQTICAQSKQNSLIKGTVTDAETKSPLPGANIIILGTSNGTTANMDGEYSLVVSSTNFEIEVSYLGNETKDIPIEISPGETKIVNIELAPGATALDEVILSGTLDGQRKALNQQRAADNLRNVISADQMGKFPDQNSAESLQRVSGINVEQNEGDGRFVLVRGLAPQFTTVMIPMCLYFGMALKYPWDQQRKNTVLRI